MKEIKEQVKEILLGLLFTTTTAGNPANEKIIEEALTLIETEIFNQCEAISQEYQKRIRENYILKSELLEKLPKELKNAHEELGYEIYYQKGFNDCLSQIHQIIEEICK